MSIELRDYQINLQSQIRASLRRHRSVLAVSPTGSGKTVTFCHMIAQAAARGKTSCVLVHRQELIDQVSHTLNLFGVPHGYVAASRHTDLTKPVSVCSIQTLVNRLDRIPAPDFVIVDEAHHASAGSWKKTLSHWSQSYVVGFTATPERLDGRPLSGQFSELVMGPSVASLIRRGMLAEPRYHLVPSSLQGAQIKRSGRDYNKHDLEAATMEATGSDGATIFGDAVGHYSMRIPGRPAIVFTPSIHIAEIVRDQFRGSGWRAETLTGSHSDEERKDRVDGLATGRYHVLVTVDLVSEGFDVPLVEAVILLRKTASLGLFLQQVGRALRPAEGKSLAHIFDHVGNVIEHGLIEQDRSWSLSGKIDRKREQSQSGVQVRRCPECYCSHAPADTCPQCGHAYQAAEREWRVVAGELVEMRSGISVSPDYTACRCGHIHTAGACPRCGYDEEEAERKKKKQEEWQCNSVEELYHLGMRRGYADGDGRRVWHWANRMWGFRKGGRGTKKQDLILT